MCSFYYGYVFKFATIYFSMESEDLELVPLNIYLSTSLELLKTRCVCETTFMVVDVLDVKVGLFCMMTGIS